MKTIIFLLILSVSFSAHAQRMQNRAMQDTTYHQQMTTGQGMMGGGMQGMMGGRAMTGGMGTGMGMGAPMCPFHQRMGAQMMPGTQYLMTVRMLPNMQEELSLTDQQVNQLIEMQANFKKQQADLQAECAKRRLDMKKLQTGNVSADQLRQALNGLNNARTNLIVAAYEATNRMKNVLNEDQKKQFDELVSQCMNNGCMKNQMMSDQ